MKSLAPKTQSAGPLLVTAPGTCFGGAQALPSKELYQMLGGAPAGPAHAM
jgi:hypothetical protein